MSMEGEATGPREVELFKGWGVLGGGLLGDRDPFKEFSTDPYSGDTSGTLKYSCQTYARSSVMGEDGQVRTERFASSHVGDREHGIREAQQAYSNSSTGILRTGFERHLGDRAMKVAMERDANMQERSARMFRGMEEVGLEAFGRDFAEKAHFMPRHPGGRGMLEASAGWLGALPAPSEEPEAQAGQ